MHPEKKAIIVIVEMKQLLYKTFFKSDFVLNLFL